MKPIAFACIACLLPTTAAAQDPSSSPETTDVLVLGTYHMANPGADIANVEADDVTTPKRQAELQALADRLASFGPTVIAIECRTSSDTFEDPRYASFEPADLLEERNETVQIGYRLASQLDLDAVYCIDEQDGEIPYFPFEQVQAFAERKGQSDRLNSKVAEIQKLVAEFGGDQSSQTISQLLAQQNDPDIIRQSHQQFYYGLMDYADTTDQPGARLNYGWYARNALIFAKLTAVTEPGDRALVIYGAGHNYWLRHFAQETPGFSLVDPLPYLDAPDG